MLHAINNIEPRSKTYIQALVHYNCEITYDNTTNTIMVILELSLKTHAIAAELYLEFAETMEEIKKQEAEKFILVKD